MEDTKNLVEELELKLRLLTNPVEQNANKAAREIVRTLSFFLRDGGSLPDELLISIGSSLVSRIADGEQMSNDIRFLYDLIEEAAAAISSEDTIKSSG